MVRIGPFNQFIPGRKAMANPLIKISPSVLNTKTYESSNVVKVTYENGSSTYFYTPQFNQDSKIEIGSKLTRTENGQDNYYKEIESFENKVKLYKTQENSLAVVKKKIKDPKLLFDIDKFTKASQKILDLKLEHIVPFFPTVRKDTYLHGVMKKIEGASAFDCLTKGTIKLEHIKVYAQTLLIAHLNGLILSDNRAENFIFNEQFLVRIAIDLDALPIENLFGNFQYLPTNCSSLLAILKCKTHSVELKLLLKQAISLFEYLIFARFVTYSTQQETLKLNSQLREKRPGLLESREKFIKEAVLTIIKEDHKELIVKFMDELNKGFFNNTTFISLQNIGYSNLFL